MRIGIGLLLVGLLVLSGCSPALKLNQDQQRVGLNVQGTVPASELGKSATPEPVLIVTPRGDHLVATDPSSVNLSSGVPTLVEFFRFT